MYVVTTEGRPAIELMRTSIVTLVVLGRRLRRRARCALMRSRRLRSASLWLLDAASALASMISCAVIRPKSPNGDDANGGGIIIPEPPWCPIPM